MAENKESRNRKYQISSLVLGTGGTSGNMLGRLGLAFGVAVVVVSGLWLALAVFL